VYTITKTEKTSDQGPTKGCRTVDERICSEYQPTDSIQYCRNSKCGIGPTACRPQQKQLQSDYKFQRMSTKVSALTSDFLMRSANNLLLHALPSEVARQQQISGDRERKHFLQNFHYYLLTYYDNIYLSNQRLTPN
jgi:hypothetical protein